MHRRRFLLMTSLGGALAVPLAAQGQQTRKIVTLGRLSLTPFLPRPGREPSDPIIDGLRELGYIEGRDFMLERRDANGVAERLPKLAEELVRIPVDVILVTGITATVAARRATRTIPIVCMTNDPVRQGFVQSLAHPGTNVTGVTLTPLEMSGKFLQLLREVVPGLLRVGYLRSAHNPATEPAVFFSPGSVSELKLVTVEIENPAGLDRAFEIWSAANVQAVTSDGDPLTDSLSRRIVEFAMKRRLPGMYPRRHFVEQGGLMSYGPDLHDTWKRAAVHVVKILRGAKPADLPLEQPTTFELVINLKTSKALGLTIPPSLLARADQVIE